MDASSQIVDAFRTVNDLLIAGRVTVKDEGIGFRANLIGVFADFLSG